MVARRLRSAVSIVVGMVVVLSVSFAYYPLSAKALPPVSSGMLMYGEGTVATPRTRSWAPFAGLGNETSAAVTAATIRHVVVKASPVRDELLAGIQTTGGQLYVMRFDGTSWSSAWNVAISNRNSPPFDIAYEQTSGEAVVVYSGNVATTNELRYRVWNGSAWTAATNLDAVRTTGVVHGVQLASRPGSNDIGLVWGDANLDVSAQFWNGSANTWIGEPASLLSSNVAVIGTSTSLTSRSFGVAFESLSGEMLVAWGNNATNGLNSITRGSGAAGAWGTAAADTSFSQEPTDFSLIADPASDFIAYANATDNNGGVLDAGVWNGSAWTAVQTLDATIDTIGSGTRNVAVAWMSEGTQTRALVTYDDLNAVGLDWTYYNKITNTWAAIPGDFIAAPAAAGGNDVQHVLVANPYNGNQALSFVVDSNSNLLTKKVVFDGTNFTWTSVEPGGVSPELTVSVVTGSSVDYAFYQAVASGTAVADIVTAAGVPVAAPSIAMSPVNALITCQATTGTLGSTTEKIRIFNSASTPSWTLSAAPTAGVAASWGGAIDFNDPAGTTAGCADGTDADALAGRLQFMPGLATTTPSSGCTTNGVSKSADAGFSQGTIDSVTLVTASTAAMKDCYWDISGIGVKQQIPGETAAGTYNLDITLTVTAN